jgi:hypothetical protein
VCWVHGLNAKQTRAKRDQRVALWEVQEARAAEPVVMVQREPEELLLAALDDVNQVLSAVKSQMQNNIVDPILLEVLGDWMDRLGRLGKVALDGDSSERLEKRVGCVAADRAQQMWGMLAAVLKAAPLTAQDRLVLWSSVFDAARLVAGEREPLRLSRDEVQRFTAELQTAAAREQAVAEGIRWDEDSPETEDDVGDVGCGVEGGSVDCAGPSGVVEQRVRCGAVGC